MNAYELADEIDSIAKDWLGQNKSGQLANMLRQQADRIAELEKQSEPKCIHCWDTGLTGGYSQEKMPTQCQCKTTPQTKPAPEGLIDPKSYYIGYEDGKKAPQTKCLDCGKINPAEIHTCSPQKKPLSDEEITDVFVTCLLPDGEFDEHEFARAIEERHGIK